MNNFPYKSFGRYLQRLRKDERMTQAQVVAAIQRQDIPFSQGSIAQYETGRIAPGRIALQGLAKVYKRNYAHMVIQLVKLKYGVDLTVKSSKWI